MMLRRCIVRRWLRRLLQRVRVGGSAAWPSIHVASPSTLRSPLAATCAASSNCLLPPSPALRGMHLLSRPRARRFRSQANLLRKSAGPARRKARQPTKKGCALRRALLDLFRTFQWPLWAVSVRRASDSVARPEQALQSAIQLSWCVGEPSAAPLLLRQASSPAGLFPPAGQRALRLLADTFLRSIQGSFSVTACNNWRRCQPPPVTEWPSPSRGRTGASCSC